MPEEKKENLEKDVVVNTFKELIGEVKKEISEEVKENDEKKDKAFKDMKKELLNLGNKIAKNNNVDEEIAEKVGKAFNDTVAVATNKKDAMTTGDLNFGQALMLEDVQEAIIRIARNFGTIMRFADVRHTIKHDYTLRFGGNDIIDGGYDDELADGSANQKLSVTKKTISLKKWRVFIGLSQEEREDSNDAILGNLILTSIAESLSLHTEREGYSTISNDANVPVKAINDLSYDELLSVQELVDEDAMVNSAYFINRKSWFEVKKLKDLNGQPLIVINNKNIIENTKVSEPQNIQPVGYIDSRPVYLVSGRVLQKSFSNAVSGEVIGYFGDLKLSTAVVIRKSLEVEEDTDFRTEEISVKGRMRKNFTTKLINTVVVIKKA